VTTSREPSTIVTRVVASSTSTAFVADECVSTQISNLGQRLRVVGEGAGGEGGRGGDDRRMWRDDEPSDVGVRLGFGGVCDSDRLLRGTTRVMSPTWG
jgi:hypothetical protein